MGAKHVVEKGALALLPLGLANHRMSCGAVMQ